MRVAASCYHLQFLTIYWRLRQCGIAVSVGEWGTRVNIGIEYSGIRSAGKDHSGGDRLWNSDGDLAP